MRSRVLITLCFLATACAPARSDDAGTPDGIAIETGWWRSAELVVSSDVCGAMDDVTEMHVLVLEADLRSFLAEWTVDATTACTIWTDPDGTVPLDCTPSEYIVDVAQGTVFAGTLGFVGTATSPSLMSGVVEMTVTCSGDACSSYDLTAGEECLATLDATFEHDQPTSTDPEPG